MGALFTILAISFIANPNSQVSVATHIAYSQFSIHPTIVNYKCYILIGYSATVREKAKENNMATAENSRFAEVSVEFSWYK